eukprot:5528971-Amphidinium_carterae.1
MLALRNKRSLVQSDVTSPQTKMQMRSSSASPQDAQRYRRVGLVPKVECTVRTCLEVGCILGTHFGLMFLP